MFGLGFLAPLFVAAGVIGASIPIILHLLNRERARQLIFSTVRFIQMSHQTNVRRHKLKRLLLLLIRILILALLGVAFARPFFAAAPVITQKIGGKRNAVIILDTSYSMQYEEVFQKAKEEGTKILDRLDSTDAACLILSSDKARVVAPLGSELSHLRSALNAAEVTYEPTDYLDALQTANEILESIPIGQKQIYLVSDMQKRGWENFIETDKLNPDVQIEFINIGVKQPKNLAITGVSVPPVVLNEQQASHLIARVHNYGAEPVESLPVRLFINENMIQTVQLNIEPDDLADAVFKIDFQNEATHTGWVELPADGLGVDNKRYFTLHSLQSIKVHAVSNQSRTRSSYPPNAGRMRPAFGVDSKPETFFMKMAFVAGSDAVPIDFSESTTVPNARVLGRTDVLILADVARFSSAEADRIKAYVAAGGGLIVTVGDNFDAAAYEQYLGGESGVMPCNFVQAVGDAFDREAFRVLATVKYEHPIFAPFKEPNHGDFGKARFYRIFQAVPTAAATVIAAYDDGSPALFEKSYGDPGTLSATGTPGRILCFTSTIDREWNDLPIRAVYLPFLHEAIKYLALKDVETSPDYRVGDSIELNAEAENAGTQRDQVVAVFNPNKVETRLQYDENNAITSVFYTDTGIPGIYSVHASGAAARYFVINSEATESDLASRDIEELTSMLKGSVDESVADKPTAELIAQYHEGVENRQDVWMYLMLAVFALAVTEMFLANRV